MKLSFLPISNLYQTATGLVVAFIFSGLPICHAETTTVAEIINPRSNKNELVVRVNGEAISRVDVEKRMKVMPRQLISQIQGLVRQGKVDRAKQARDQWWNIEFSLALKELIKEKLIIQDSVEEKHKGFFLVKPEAVQERLASHWQAVSLLKTAYVRLRIPADKPMDQAMGIREFRELVQNFKPSWRLLGRIGRPSPYTITKEELSKAILEDLQVRSFRRQWDGQQVTRPEIEKFYKDHLDNYKQKKGYKVRLIQMDWEITDSTTGQRSPRGKPSELRKKIQSWREWILNSSEDAERLAREKSTNEDSAKRGGLLEGKNGGDYVTEDDCPRRIYRIIRNAKVNFVSEVQQVSGRYYYFVILEGIRLEGVKPLEGELFAEIEMKLSKQKSKKSEDKWFREALDNALIIRQGQRWKTSRFFPDVPAN